MVFAVASKVAAATVPGRPEVETQYARRRRSDNPRVEVDQPGIIRQGPAIDPVGIVAGAARCVFALDMLVVIGEASILEYVIQIVALVAEPITSGEPGLIRDAA